MYLSEALVAEVPLEVVTVTSTVPTAWAGEVAVQVELVEQLTDVPAVAPKAAVVEPGTNPEPEMVTVAPPPGGPATGLTPVTDGARVRLWVDRADGPPLFDTVWPVKTWAVEVPAVSVTVRVAVKGPEVE